MIISLSNNTITNFESIRITICMINADNLIEYYVKPSLLGIASIKFRPFSINRGLFYKHLHKPLY